MDTSTQTTSTTLASNHPRQSLLRSPTFHQALAGFLGGATTTILLHPLDLVKIRFQVDNKRRAGILRGTVAALRTIHSQDGFVGLYRGLSPNFIASTLSWGFYFTCYDTIKSKLRKHISPTADLTPAHHLLASSITGILTCLLTNPIWILKIRMCADRAADPHAYQTFRAGFRDLYTNEGVRGLYRGLVPALFGVTQKSVQFVAYEELKRWRIHVRNGKIGGGIHERESGTGLIESGKNASLNNGADKLGTIDFMGIATVSKLFAMGVTYPYQVVRARIQNQRGNNAGAYKSTLGTISVIYHGEGVSGFYKGIGPNLIRVLPGSVLMFVVYESVSKACRMYLA
ncbi:hypothetical protein HK100_002058 [Physocladia obscura]|uniref:Uncharacterized protein n=1 Tax=Physocladia obscura TaxID=109957 RepID=A0AAD5SXY2_9FUNG|nr:hypothetical protein HK100_002058 [Physocladia obscura]